MQVGNEEKLQTAVVLTAVYKKSGKPILCNSISVFIDLRSVSVKLERFAVPYFCTFGRCIKIPCKDDFIFLFLERIAAIPERAIPIICATAFAQ